MWLTYLVQQECAMARHSSSVVHHGRDVAGETQMRTGFTKLMTVIYHAGDISVVQSFPGSSYFFAKYLISWKACGQIIPIICWVKMKCSTGCLVRGDTGYSLSVGLQLTDLKEYHQVIFAVAGSCLRAGHCCQLGGRYCVEKRRERVLDRE